MGCRLIPNEEETATYNYALSSLHITNKRRSLRHGVNIQSPRIADECYVDILLSRQFVQCISESIGAKHLILMGCHNGNLKTDGHCQKISQGIHYLD